MECAPAPLNCAPVFPLNDLVLLRRVTDVAALAVIENNMTLRVTCIPVDDHIAFFKLIRVKRNDILPRILNKTVYVHNAV